MLHPSHAIGLTLAAALVVAPIAPRATPAPASPLAQRPALVAAVDSERPDGDVRQVALHHAAEVRGCYESQGLRRNPGLSGIVEIELRVLPTGVVDSARISASQLDGSGKLEVERCIVDTARNWRFDRGPFAVETIVYPFTLTPTFDGPTKLRSA